MLHSEYCGMYLNYPLVRNGYLRTRAFYFIICCVSQVSVLLVTPHVISTTTFCMLRCIQADRPKGCRFLSKKFGILPVAPIIRGVVITFSRFHISLISSAKGKYLVMFSEYFFNIYFFAVGTVVSIILVIYASLSVNRMSGLLLSVIIPIELVAYFLMGNVGSVVMSDSIFLRC